MRGVENSQDDDAREVEAKVLPTREALSLIAPDPVSDEQPDADVAASGGGEESVASDDRTLSSGP